MTSNLPNQKILPRYAAAPPDERLSAREAIQARGCQRSKKRRSAQSGCS